MKRSLKKYILLGIVLICIGCGDSNETAEEGVVLSGTLENPPLDLVLFEIVRADGVKVLDTIPVEDDGSFKSSYAVQKPSFYRLNFGGRQYVTMILTGEEDNVVINADGNAPDGFFDISGSRDTELKNQMDELVKSYRKNISQLQQAQIQARSSSNRNEANSIALKMRSEVQETQATLKNMIRDASPSLAAFYGLQLIDQQSNIAFIDSISSELVAALPENDLILELRSRLEASSRLAVGAQAPEISLPDQDGNVVTLSSLKGNYVLIDFWAAWCRPCRAENPNVVRVYNQYSDKNFEILGVSLDRTKQAWLNAIQQDGLPWLHVSDLQYWRSEAAQAYQVSAIPATFLIDPEGTIIAKNLRGISLQAKLEELFL